MREVDRGVRKHAPVVERVPGTFYLMSVRDPLAQYVSLFRYGVGGNGSLRAFIEAKGHGELYDISAAGPVAALERWLDFVLRPRNAEVLGEGYHISCPGLIGFQTFRFMMLAVPNALERLRNVESRTGLRDIYAVHGLPEAVIRTEHLREDLGELIDGPLAPRLRDAGKARQDLYRTAPVNVGNSAPQLQDASVSAELVSRVRAREWFVYERFYADAA